MKFFYTVEGEQKESRVFRDREGEERSNYQCWRVEIDGRTLPGNFGSWDRARDYASDVLHGRDLTRWEL